MAALSVAALSVAGSPVPVTGPPGARRGATGGSRERIVDAALRAFGSRGYDATSLDALAADVGVRKQTILHHFASKDVLLEAAIDTAGASLVGSLEDALAQAGPGWDQVEAIVRSVFRLAGRRPELLGLLREVSRLGPPPATRLRERLDPFIIRATGFLEDEMAVGRVRRQDARLLLLATYSTVIGVATEVEVLRALGMETTVRSLVRRRAELLDFLRSALAVSSDQPAFGPAVF